MTPSLRQHQISSAYPAALVQSSSSLLLKKKKGKRASKTEGCHGLPLLSEQITFLSCWGSPYPLLTHPKCGMVEKAKKREKTDTLIPTFPLLIKCLHGDVCLFCADPGPAQVFRQTQGQRFLQPPSPSRRVPSKE